MARGLRDIRRKLKAVKSTRQVTKAMELVAASKMRRAVESAERLRRYAQGAWSILRRIAIAHGELHSFFQERPVEKVLVVLMTSDSGLCGSLNAHIIRASEEYLRKAKEARPGEKTDFLAIGRKGQQFLRRSGQNVVAAFPALSNHPTFRDALPITRFVIDAFQRGTYDHVVFISPRFLSALRQEIDASILLPLSSQALHIQDTASRDNAQDHEEKILEFTFEPSPAEVLNTIVPQLTEVQIYQRVLESAASEHSARMVAMRNASDNASDILDGLTLTYNQTRQAGITSELAELSASSAALGG